MCNHINPQKTELCKYDMDPTSPPRDEKIRAQMELESLATQMGIGRYQKGLTTMGGNQRDLCDQPVGQVLMRQWVEPLGVAIGEYLTTPRRGGSKATKQAKETLTSLALTPNEMAFLAINRLLGASFDTKGQQGVNLATCCTTLGRALVSEVQAREFQESHKNYVQAILDNHKLVSNKKESIIEAIRRGKASVMGATELDKELSNVDAYTLGSEILRITLVICSDWFTYQAGKGKNRRGMVVLTPMAREWIDGRNDFASILRPIHRPMIIPPLDWDANGVGGYLTHNLELTRKGRNMGNQHTTKASPECRRAINIAQRTPWVINKDVLGVVKHLMAQGNGVAGLPVLERVAEGSEGIHLRESDPEAHQAFRKSQMLAMQTNIRMASKILSVKVKIEIAEDYSNCEEVYFPHSFDWRGRVYPIPTSLNPQGDDLSKALLAFAKGEPLGPEGYRWLLVHTANVFGNDKLSFDDRIQWVMDNEDAMIRVAKDPLGYLWWAEEADSPWKFLACCFEIARIAEWDGALADFVTHIPVALDGTCSGLQHFSALLRDERGGASVNLVPSPKPADIYSEVAQEVLLGVEAEGDCWQARVWDGFIDRGTCKRGTMTQPYSVTRRGMGDQLIDLLKTDKKYAEVPHRVTFEAAKVRDKLTDAEWEALDQSDKPSFAKACTWLAGILGDSINKVVVASEQGREFLCAVASCYDDAEMYFKWTTPLGMEIQQGYRKLEMIRVNTFFGSARARVQLLDDGAWMLDVAAPNDKRKTKSGASPNFIHSLDASHLMMTVLECYDRAGMDSLALVHDSFGVHAGKVPVLSQALRGTFVQMYRMNILEGLLEQAKVDLPEELHENLPELPQMGSLNLDMVMRSPYLFS